MQDKDKGTHNKDDDHELMCVCVCCCIIGGNSIENVKEQVIKWSGRETNGKRLKECIATITALLFIYEGTNNLHYIMLYLWPNIKPCPWDAGDASAVYS